MPRGERPHRRAVRSSLERCGPRGAREVRTLELEPDSPGAGSASLCLLSYRLGEADSLRSIAALVCGDVVSLTAVPCILSLASRVSRARAGVRACVGAVFGWFGLVG